MLEAPARVERVGHIKYDQSIYLKHPILHMKDKTICYQNVSCEAQPSFRSLTASV